MGHLNIYCDCCGSSWTVYHRDNWKDWKARTCPVCGNTIQESTWTQVIRAFGEMEDSTLELVKDHTQTHGALFTVSYEPDVIYPNSKGSAETEALREDIEELRDSVESLKTLSLRTLDAIFID